LAVREPRAYVGGSLTWGTVQSAWIDTAWQGVPQTNAGSYSINWWLCDAAWHQFGPLPHDPPLSQDFRSEFSLVQPARTPVIIDGGLSRVLPGADDYPAADIFAVKPLYSNMATMALPRHGNRPNAPPIGWPTNQRLPGAVNVAFFDGHGEPVKLDALWQLYWHLGYQARATRPGL